MQNIYPVVAIVIGLILSVSYFLYIKRKAKEKAWDTATNYITTILSILIGAMISILIYNYQKNSEERQRRLELKTSLEAELYDTKRILLSGEKITVNGLPFLTTYIQPIIAEECAKSGFFKPINVENLLHLSRKIKFYNVQVTYFLSLLTNSEGKEFSSLLENCNKNMETSRKAILSDIEQIKDEMSLTLPDYK